MRIFTGSLFCAALLTAALPVQADGKAAHPAQAAAAAGIVLDQATVRAVPPVSQNSVAFLRIRNTGKQADVLLDISTPIAAVAELHSMTMVGDVMHMDRLPSLPVAAGATVVLDPDSRHIMLMGLKAPLHIGQQVPFSLHFRKAGVVAVQATVVADEP